VPIHEAFLLIFRRGGPDVELPESYHAGDSLIYPVYIDIAATTEAGSRQSRQPIRISAEQLAATSDDKPADRECGADGVTGAEVRRST